MKREALIDRDYRYWLSRDWSEAEGSPYVLWVMLNPSIADGKADDPTVRKCIGFTTRLGYQRLFVVNLFALRATDPNVLTTARESGVDIVGPCNDSYIVGLAKTAPVIIFAWGAYEGVDVNGRAVEVGSLLARPDARCLGYSKTGQPRHPLMMPYYAATQLKPWPRLGGAA